ncbi:hypothetical protein KLP28_03565 [Nocardioidaceae bacterium]|nr:hypothetical protein KLP28_03565 [Nocardioidaceae bacterium]
MLSGTDFARPLHPDAARSLAARAFRLLRLALIGVIVLAVVLSFWLSSVFVLLQGLAVALIGVPALAALRVLLDAALTVIAELHDEKAGGTRSVS